MNPNILVVDAGDWGDPSPDHGVLKTDFIFKMMKRFGTDVVTLGQRELKLGVEHFQELAQGSPAIVTSNLRRQENGKLVPVGQESFIKDMGGVRVGVFSLIDEGLLLSSQLERTDYKAESIFSEAERMTDRLEKEGCEIIVLLAQMELAFTDSILRQVPDIDVAVLGFRGGLRATHSTIGKTIVVRPGSKGQYVGWLDLVVGPDSEIVEYGGRAISLEKPIRDDPGVTALVNEVQNELNQARKEAQVLKQNELRNQEEVDRYLGGQICSRCHQPEYERWASSGHAKAWKTLVDLDMDSSKECVSCHVTGFGKATGFEHKEIKPDLTGVQCESCHDMGTLHQAGAKKTALTASACTGCHDQANSPEFEFKSYLEKIRHW